jgi:hypothetical protein
VLISSHQLNCWSSLLLCIKWSQEELPHLTNLIAEFFPSDCNSVMFKYSWFLPLSPDHICIKYPLLQNAQKARASRKAGLHTPDYCCAVNAAAALVRTVYDVYMFNPSQNLMMGECFLAICSEYLLRPTVDTVDVKSNHPVMLAVSTLPGQVGSWVLT